MPRDGIQAAPTTRKLAKHIKPNARRIRTPENAEMICDMVEDGRSIREIAIALGCRKGSISSWLNDDQRENGGAEIAGRYARAVEVRMEALAEQTLEIADEKSFLKGNPQLANAIVAQQRLAVDTRKWLLSKMLPKKYGDRVEISGDPNAPVVTRIELVAVQPKLEAPYIDNDEDL